MYRLVILYVQTYWLTLITKKTSLLGLELILLSCQLSIIARGLLVSPGVTTEK